MRFQIIEETACRISQFYYELLIEGVEVRFAIEANNSDAAVLFDGHIFQLHENTPSELFFTTPLLSAGSLYPETTSLEQVTLTA